MKSSDLLRKRIVIVDSEEMSTIFRYILESTGRYKIIATYPSFEEAIPFLKKDRPDVLITEIELEGMSGVEGLKELNYLFPSIEVVVCSNFCNHEVLVECFHLGAVGFLLKDESHNRLITLLDDLGQGGSTLSPTAARILIQSYRRNPHSPLTFRETEILRLVAKGNTYTQIASSLKISPETSKVHMRNIYKKLNVNSKSLALKRAMEEKMI